MTELVRRQIREATKDLLIPPLQAIVCSYIPNFVLATFKFKNIANEIGHNQRVLLIKFSEKERLLLYPLGVWGTTVPLIHSGPIEFNLATCELTIGSGSDPDCTFEVPLD